MASIRSHNPYHTEGSAAVPTQTAAGPVDDGFGWLDPEDEPIVDGVSYRMLMCGLPLEEITNEDIVELFRDSVGAVKSARLLFNEAGLSVGIALVTFYRGVDCKRAHAAFDGKEFDGQQTITLRPILDISQPIPPSLASIIVPQIPLKCFPTVMAQPPPPHISNRQRLAALAGPRPAQLIAAPVAQSEPVAVEVPMMVVEPAQQQHQPFDTNADFIQLGGSSPATTRYGNGGNHNNGRGKPPSNAPRGPAGNAQSRGIKNERDQGDRERAARQNRNSSHPYQKVSSSPSGAAGGSNGMAGNIEHGQANGSGGGGASGSGQGKSLLDRMQVSLVDRIGGIPGGSGAGGGQTGKGKSAVVQQGMIRPANGRVVSDNDKLIAVQKARLAAAHPPSASRGNMSPGGLALAHRLGGGLGGSNGGKNSGGQAQNPSKATPKPPVQTLPNKSKPVASKPVAKTQDDLDREMELYNRQRRFGGDAMDTT